MGTSRSILTGKGSAAENKAQLDALFEGPSETNTKKAASVPLVGRGTMDLSTSGPDAAAKSTFIKFNAGDSIARTLAGAPKRKPSRVWQRIEKRVNDGVVARHTDPQNARYHYAKHPEKTPSSRLAGGRKPATESKPTRKPVIKPAGLGGTASESPYYRARLWMVQLAGLDS